MASSKKRRDGGLVWDSEVGSVCPGCAQPVATCSCASASTTPEGDGVVRVALDRKGRNGKVVTVITGIRLPADEFGALAKELKRRCGAGGKAVDGCIEIQGDRRDELLVELRKRGFTVKRVGG